MSLTTRKMSNKETLKHVSLHMYPGGRMDRPKEVHSAYQRRLKCTRTKADTDPRWGIARMQHVVQRKPGL